MQLIQYAQDKILGGSARKIARMYICTTMVNKADILLFIKTLIARELKREISEIDDEASFHHLGLDSVNSIFLLSEVEEQFKIYIDPLSLFDNPTVASFAGYIHTAIHGAR